MVLASLGFAATAIGSHGGWWRMLTGTTATTTMTSTNPEGRHVFLCHFTGRHHHEGGESWIHEVTIMVGQPAVWAHLRHGDELGPCPLPPGQTTTQSTTTTTASGDEDGDRDDGNGQGDSGGNGWGHDSGPSTGTVSGQGQGDQGQGHHHDD
jgi:hypothetical protein